MENEQKDRRLLDLGSNSRNFINSIYSLRNFSIKIGSIASKEDQNVIGSFSKNISRHLGIDDNLKNLIEETNKKEELINSLDPSVDKANIEQLRLEIDSEKEKTFGEIQLIISQNYSKDMVKELVYKELVTMTKKSPSYSNLLRIGALTTLISIVENLFGELIRYYYYKYPNALPSDARILTLTELKEMGSIQEAEIFITSKEVEGILRSSYEDQIAFFEKKIKIDISYISDIMSNTSEVYQRRNLFVHNEGIVNKIYIKKVSSILLDKFNATLGNPLYVSEEYLLEAINLILISGLVISQLCWRKWEKEQKENADDIILDILFDALIDENYELNVTLSKFFPYITFSSDYIFKVASINVAIALKQLNKTTEMEEYISKIDWSSSSLKFDIALKALRNQNSELVPLIIKAISIDELKKSSILEWPLFKEFRNSEEFKSVLNVIST